MVQVMTLNKLFHQILLIAAFIYLIMCPAVPELGDNIKHYVALKVEAKILQKDFKNSFNSTPLKLSNNSQGGFFVQPMTAQGWTIFSSLHSTLTLSILSTIRLVL